MTPTMSKTLTLWQPSLSDLRVLIVEDEPDARELVAGRPDGAGRRSDLCRSLVKRWKKWSGTVRRLGLGHRHAIQWMAMH